MGTEFEPFCNLSGFKGHCEQSQYFEFPNCEGLVIVGGRIGEFTLCGKDGVNVLSHRLGARVVCLLMEQVDKQISLVIIVLVDDNRRNGDRLPFA